MAEQRLIDANALDFALVDEYITDNSLTAALTGKGRCIFNAAIDIARCRVADAETVDVVPVVRCRECKKRGHDWECPLCWMEWFENEHIEGHFEKHDETEDDGFCHKGEKMRGEANENENEK